MQLIDDGVLVPEHIAVEIGDGKLVGIDGGHQVHGAPPVVRLRIVQPNLVLLALNATGETAPDPALSTFPVCLVTVMPLTWN